MSATETPQLLRSISPHFNPNFRIYPALEQTHQFFDPAVITLMALSCNAFFFRSGKLSFRLLDHLNQKHQKLRKRRQAQRRNRQ